MRKRPPKRPANEPTPGDIWPDDEDTIIEMSPYVAEETPVEVPRCVECGAIVFVDNAAVVTFPDDHCLRALDGHWHWCAKLRKAVTYVPR